MNKTIKEQLGMLKAIPFKVDGQEVLDIPQDFTEITFMHSTKEVPNPDIEKTFIFDDYIVKPYEGFDFHDKFNGGLPPYQKVMYGKIIKETDKMYQLVARTADGFKIWAGWVPKKSMRIMS